MVRRGSGVDRFAQVGDIGTLAFGTAGCLDDDVRTRRATRVGDGCGIDLAAADVRVSVRPGVEEITAVVGVDQVDTPGDSSNPVDDADQVLPAGVRMAGIE